MLESRWCQFEILEARRLQRPLIVLDALDSFAPRISPFLSNMPVVRWSHNPAEVVSALLLELVRTRYLEALFHSLVISEKLPPQFRLYPPDLMERERNDVASTGDLTHDQLVVYPDPPLAAEELSFLSENYPLLSFQSLSQWSALRALNSEHPERKTQSRSMHVGLRLNVAISISETDDWKSLGLIPDHQEEIATDLARQLILLGVRLLWGGDLRPKGIGSRFESLVRAYHQSDHAPQDHITCYLAWPNHRDMSQEQLQRRRAIADLLCLPQPGDEVDKSPAHDALCFSLMRQRMAADSDVRIILGGSTTTYRGRYAGVAEEALESVNAGVPLYIIGGFGGAARAIFDMIAEPNSKSELDAGWEMRCQDEVRQMQHDYNRLAKRVGLSLQVNYAELRNSFTSLGMSGLCELNKLSSEENHRLSLTTDIHEIASIVVRGLSRLSRDKSLATSLPA
jgi:SLOG cluster2